ncbi:MAG: chorismate synthase [Ruminococcaceae bacterium]|jgi:chorismate synthase|nr:chorismate synthase [Oscillospiraceae bacterium]
MKNSFGDSLILTLFGESHGKMIGATLDGLAPGMEVDGRSIRAALDLRRPRGAISTARSEADEFEIVSGVFNGKTTGTPLTILIPNADTRSGDYSYGVARPSHADLTAFIKYHGFEDYRGGGHFSGRLTAAVVAVCAPLRDALRKKGIGIGTHILRIGELRDRNFDESNLTGDIEALSAKFFPVLEDEAAEAMTRRIEEEAGAGDSVGGILETAVAGLPAGLGEPFFDSVESRLAHAVFSVPAVKGVEFGAGFGFADMTGSAANDPIRVSPDGGFYTVTNHSGGINGGISNGMPILMRTAVKPTPSIRIEQDTVNFLTGENAVTEVRGRHDPAIIHRARIVVDSLCAFVLADLMTARFGTDCLA